MKQAASDIVNKFRQRMGQITTLTNDNTRTNSRLTSPDAAAREIYVTVQQIQQSGQSQNQGQQFKFHKGILEYKMIEGIKPVTGDEQIPPVASEIRQCRVAGEGWVRPDHA